MRAVGEEGRVEGAAAAHGVIELKQNSLGSVLPAQGLLFFL
jgi:hypothetical protein